VRAPRVSCAAIPQPQRVTLLHVRRMQPISRTCVRREGGWQGEMAERHPQSLHSSVPILKMKKKTGYQIPRTAPKHVSLFLSFSLSLFPFPPLFARNRYDRVCIERVNNKYFMYAKIINIEYRAIWDFNAAIFLERVSN